MTDETPMRLLVSLNRLIKLHWQHLSTANGVFRHDFVTTESLFTAPLHCWRWSCSTICFAWMYQTWNHVLLPIVKLERQLTVNFVVLHNFPNKSLKGYLANEQFRAFYVLSNFIQRHSTGSVAMRFLDTLWSRLLKIFGRYRVMN